MSCEDCSTDDLCRCGPGETCGHCFESKEPTPRCTCADAGDGFAPLGHYADCPQAEPPLTPEEEEEARGCVNERGCGFLLTNDCERGCRHAADELSREANEKPPPQPGRRPPIAVAYSVQGHLYEVAVSGDASVRAVDGALVIQHHLGPVAGIVRVLPVINEES